MLQSPDFSHLTPDKIYFLRLEALFSFSEFFIFSLSILHIDFSLWSRKIIGARWYIRAYEAEFGPLNRSDVKEFLSPRDALGHGSHTSSTAAGLFVDNVNFIGLAPGSARGGAPQARIAMYKVCWATGDCSSADILAAFDDAIHDGVDVISVSLGSPPPLDAYFEDPIAVGSFHALEKGIVVVCSAGNSGPFSETVTNTAPWLITVAASTIDRSFPTAITLGNNQTFKVKTCTLFNFIF
jgi:subtilisin family serine protease